jgi:hypothetical protein
MNATASLCNKKNSREHVVTSVKKSSFGLLHVCALAATQTALNMKTTVLLDVKQHILVDKCPRFGETYYFSPHGRKIRYLHPRGEEYSSIMNDKRGILL